MSDSKYLPDLEFISEYSKTIEKVAKYSVDNYVGNIYDEKDLARTYLNFTFKIMTSEKSIFKMQKEYFCFIQNQQELWKRLWTGRLEKNVPLIIPEKNDKRFNLPEWNETYFDFIKQTIELFVRPKDKRSLYDIISI